MWLKANEAEAIDASIAEQTAAASVANASVANAPAATEPTTIQETSKGLLHSELGPFDVKPRALEAAEEVSTGARWGTLMHEAMQWLPMGKIYAKKLECQTRSIGFGRIFYAGRATSIE